MTQDEENLLARLEALNASEPDDATVADDASMDAIVDGALKTLRPDCACGAPAALVTGYRGEPGPEPQCARCATTDPRMMLGSRWLDPVAGPLGRPTPDTGSEKP